MNNNQCKELMLDDIIRVDLYLTSDCNIILPLNVQYQSMTLTPTLLGVPVFSAALSGADVVMLDETPTLKVKNGRQTGGNIYTHDLTLPVMVERTAAEELVEKLLGRDFHIVYTRADGSRDLSLSLPAAAACDIDETHPTAASTTLKVKVLSYSNTIKLTATS